VELPASQDSTRPEVRVTVGSVPTAESPVPELRLWGIRKSIALAVVVALLLVGSLIAVALWYAGWPGIRRDATVTAATLFDLLKLVFAVVAGIGGVAALVVAYRRQRVAEHTNALAEFAHQLAHAADLRAEGSRALAEAADERAKVETDRNGVRLFNERFAKASEQLGSEKAAVRLAGVYAMAGLADDWHEGRQTCIDVLCAYFRMPYKPPHTLSPKSSDAGESESETESEPSADADAVRIAREEREVRHTLMRIIGAHLRLDEDDAKSWCGLDFDFTGAVFDGADLEGATFSGGRVSFEVATFDRGRVSFEGATFGGGRVSFRGAKFSGGNVSFGGSTFSGGIVSFGGASFEGSSVYFHGSKFSGGEVSFGGATLSGGQVAFHWAKFSGGDVSFMGATVSGGRLSFYLSTFSGVEITFYEAALSGGRVSFERAKISAGQLIFQGVAFCGSQVSFNRAAFNGGEVSFPQATFDGGEVSFTRAAFGGGQVHLDAASLFETPPKFDASEEPPEGLLLPAGWAWADSGPPAA
jgi:uncharacterized protein YjbI with pentapeptide repeats